MPGSRSQAETAADVETSNRERNGSGAEPLPGRKSSRVSSQMASLSNDSSACQSASNGDGEHISPLDSKARNKFQIHEPNSRRNTQGEVPSGLGDPVPKRPIEASIWNWDTPRESFGESSSSTIYYEPQGELLQEHRRQPLLRAEFSIPHAIGGPNNSGWSFADPDRRNNSDGFAVPQRPTGSVPFTAGVKRKSASEQCSGGSSKRVTRAMSESEDPRSPGDVQNTQSQAGAATRPRSETEGAGSRSRPPQPTDFEAVRPPLGILSGPGAGPRRAVTDPGQPISLPSRKVFPIQIGDKLFRLSGASISSDAPSYFSQFFEEQLRQNKGADSVRTLYIDRDPATFEDIALHLQGYHILPRDGPHFVKLFADAQFFSLPRLTAQLFSSTIYIRIGDEEFQIPRDLFSNPGDSPNYFSLGFSIFFTTPNEVFPGLSERTLLRPPSILPPSIPNKSAKTFADLLHILKGYPVEVRNEEHRQELLRDARYFHLKGLEQRLIPHEISYNLARQKTEILIRLEDIRQSGVSFVADGSNAIPTSAAPSPASSTSSTAAGPGWIYYQRPYVDSEAYSLTLEIAGEENTFLSVEAGSTIRMGRATFHKQTLQRITSLFSVIASKMNLPVTQPLGLMMLERGAGVASLPVSPHTTGMSDERVKVRIGPDADVVLNGKPWITGESNEDDDSTMKSETARSSRAGSKRRKQEEDEDEDGEQWIVKKSQWRLRVQPMTSSGGGGAATRNGMEVILGAVKIEAFSNERARNASRGFLS